MKDIITHTREFLRKLQNFIQLFRSRDVPSIMRVLPFIFRILHITKHLMAATTIKDLLPMNVDKTIEHI